MKLREIAHARAGDKGDISNISLIAYRSKDYLMIKKYVTAEKVKERFKDIVRGEVIRYELPRLEALNFVMKKALGGGVTRSLAIDVHGKTLSSILLDLEISAAELPAAGKLKNEEIHKRRRKTNEIR